MDVNLLVIFKDARASCAKKRHRYPVAPQVGDYVILPGFGDMGVAVHSRIVGGVVTLQFRDALFVEGLEAYGWEVVR